MVTQSSWPYVSSPHEFRLELAASQQVDDYLPHSQSLSLPLCQSFLVEEYAFVAALSSLPSLTHRRNPSLVLLLLLQTERSLYHQKVAQIFVVEVASGSSMIRFRSLS